MAAHYNRTAPLEQRFIPLSFVRLLEPESRARAQAFLETMRGRRSVREFSPDPVPLDVVDEIGRAHV